jgi:hypothetical protein
MWQTIRQWWQEERERWRYYWHMTRPAWYVELMTMLLIELSDRIAFLDFLDSWIFGIGSFIILLCNGYIGIICYSTSYRPEDWEDFK